MDADFRGRVLEDIEADIYTFSYSERNYPTVVADFRGRRWLVMLDMAGIMETAFVVEQPDTCFANSRFTLLGKAKELMQ